MASVTLAALAILFMPSFISPKFFKIIWLSNRFNMSVPDKGYSSSVPDKGYSSSVPDKGYSSSVPYKGYSERT